MTWREEAKQLGISLYDKELKRPRLKANVEVDIASASVPKLTVDEPESVVIEVREANAICRQALLDHVTEMGFSDVSIERCIESLIRKFKFLNCKRRGIAFKGTKNDITAREEGTGKERSEGTESESEGTGSDVSGGIREPERKDSPERPKETVDDEQQCCTA
jgi:hypothetical protein